MGRITLKSNDYNYNYFVDLDKVNKSELSVIVAITSHPLEAFKK